MRFQNYGFQVRLWSALTAHGLGLQVQVRCHNKSVATPTGTTCEIHASESLDLKINLGHITVEYLEKYLRPTDYPNWLTTDYS